MKIALLVDVSALISTESLTRDNPGLGLEGKFFGRAHYVFSAI